MKIRILAVKNRTPTDINPLQLAHLVSDYVFLVEFDGEGVSQPRLSMLVQGHNELVLEVGTCRECIEVGDGNQGTEG